MRIILLSQEWLLLVLMNFGDNNANKQQKLGLIWNNKPKTESLKKHISLDNSKSYERHGNRKEKMLDVSIGNKMI